MEKDIMTAMLEEHLPDLDEYVLIAKNPRQPARYVHSFNYAKKAIAYAKRHTTESFWYVLNKNTLETIAEKEHVTAD